MSQAVLCRHKPDTDRSCKLSEGSPLISLEALSRYFNGNVSSATDMSPSTKRTGKRKPAHCTPTIYIRSQYLSTHTSKHGRLGSPSTPPSLASRLPVCEAAAFIVDVQRTAPKHMKSTADPIVMDDCIFAIAFLGSSLVFCSHNHAACHQAYFRYGGFESSTGPSTSSSGGH